MIKRRMSDGFIEKIPSYVPIYNILYSDIINGFYSNDDMLPSENVLSEKYNVSRNTIRQALTILKEDGLICKKQGKGSIVTYQSEEENKTDHLYNLILTCAKEEINDIRIKYNFAPPTEVAIKKLELKPNEILLASNNVYFNHEKAIGHSFFQIPVKYIDKLPIDLNSENCISSLINKDIFEMAHSAKVYIRLTLAEDNVTEFLHVEEKEPLIYIEQILRDEANRGIARCKYYFIPEYFNIFLNI